MAAKRDSNDLRLATSCAAESQLNEGRSVYIYIYILVINVTAACVRGCAASVGLLVTGKRKEKGDTENCKGDVRGGGGGGGISELH